MRLKPTLLAGFALLMGGCQLTSPFADKPLDNQTLEQQHLRFHPDVERGHLDNGFRYYIAENQKPEQRVYIRFVVNAGSMNEEDDQRGVAHIVEHMAFNGSKHFAGNQVITELEQVGMKFGVDINAFTDFENTVYTLNLPSNDPQILDLVFRILADWAQHVTMHKGDLNAERGIVLEEWRARLGPMLRLGDKKSAIEMAGSRYVTRDPIGDVDTIMNVSQQRVADFYHKWYRPDNMSLVVVGDIDRQSIIAAIEQSFGDQKNPIQPMPKIDYSIPMPEGWRAASVHEPGVSSPAIELSFFRPFEPEYSLDRYRTSLADQITQRLINVRLQSWENHEHHAVNSASYYSSNSGRETTQSVFSLHLGDQSFDHATQSLFAFLAEIKQNGFSEREIRGEIKRLQTLIEKNRDSHTYSIDLVGDLMVAAATHEWVLSEADKYQLNAHLLKQMTKADITASFDRILSSDSRLLLTTQPNEEAVETFDKHALQREWSNAMSTQQTRWVIEHTEASLPILDIKAGSVKQERKWAEPKVTEYRLSNGSKLVYRFSDNNPGQVHFKALTQGGTRSVDPALYHPLRISAGLVDDSGIGELSLPELQAIFRGNPVVMSTLLDEHQQGYSGWAKTDSLESMFTLFHMRLNDNPISDKVLTRYQTEMTQRLSESGLDSEDQFVRQVSQLRFPAQATIYSLTEQDVAALNKQELSELYQTYIADKTDFTYFVVGDVSPQRMEMLAAKYLASVPVKQDGRVASMISPIAPAKPLLSPLSVEPRAEVEIYLTQPKQWRPDQAYYLELSSELVQDQLRLLLREQASGVYGVSGWFWQNHSEAHAEGRIRFSCAPERVNELVGLTKQVLAEIAEKGVDPQVFENKILQSADRIDRYLRSDLGMLDALERSYMLTDTPNLIRAEQHANQAATLDKVNQIVKDFLNQAESFEAVLMPKVMPKVQ